MKIKMMNQADIVELLVKLKEENSIKIKWKILNIFIKENKPKSADEIKILESLLDSMKIETEFDLRIKIDLAIGFHSTRIVIEGIKSPNKFISKYTLDQCRWIFQELSSPLFNPDYLTSELFPEISYSSRCKIINKLAFYNKSDKNFALFEPIFKAVESSYDLNSALPLLPLCSEDFVFKSIFETGQKLELSQTLFTRISKIHPKIGLEYVKKLEKEYTPGSLENSKRKLIYNNKNKKMSGMNKIRGKRQTPTTIVIKKSKNIYKNKIFLFLLNENPELFFEMLNSTEEDGLHYLKFREFGERMTENLIKNRTKYFLQSVKKLLPYLNYKKTVEILEKDEETFLQFFQELHNLKNKNPFFEWFDQLKKASKWKILSKIYQKEFKGEEELDIKLFCKIVNYLPAELRIKFANEYLANKTLMDKIGNIKSNSIYKDLDSFIIRDTIKNKKAFFISLKSSEDALPELKKMLNDVPFPEDRVEIISLSIYNCGLNEDTKGLVNFIKFVNKRHKNDKPEIRNAMIKSIWRNFDFVSEKSVNNFDSRHLTAFEEIFQIMEELDEDWDSFADSLLIFTINKKIENHLKSEGKIEQKLESDISFKIWMDKMILINFNDNEDNDYNYFEILKNFATGLVQKVIISQILGELSKRYPTNEFFWREFSNFLSFVIEFAEIINNWNEKNELALGRISFADFPWLLKRIEECLRFPRYDTNEGKRIALLSMEIIKCRELSGLIASRLKSEYVNEVELEKRNKKKLQKIPDEKTIQNLTKEFEDNSKTWFDGELNRKKWQILKKLPFNGYDSLIANFIQEADKNIQAELRNKEKLLKENTVENYTKKFQNSLTILSILNQDSCTKIISKFTPDKTQEIITTDKRVQALVEKSTKEMQEWIGHSLINFIEPGLALPILKKFFFGDYYNMVEFTLHSSLRKTSEKLALDFMTNVISSKNKIAVAKHTLRQFFEIAPKSKILPIFSKFYFSGEENASIDGEVLNKIFNLYFEDQTNSEVFWNAVKSSVTLISPQRTALFEIVSRKTKMQFKSSQHYSEFFCIILGNLNKEFDYSGMSNIIKGLDLQQSSEELIIWCLSFLNDNSYQQSVAKSTAILTSKYLTEILPKKKNKDEILSKILRPLNTLLEKNWDMKMIKNNKTSFLARDFFGDLVDEFIKTIFKLENYEIHCATILKLIHFLKDTSNKTNEFLSIICQLELAQLFCKHGKNVTENYELIGKMIAEIGVNFQNSFGFSSIFIFAKSLHKIMRTFFELNIKREFKIIKNEEIIKGIFGVKSEFNAESIIILVHSAYFDEMGQEMVDNLLEMCQNEKERMWLLLYWNSIKY